MKVYKDGMVLMKDTGSLTNALMENKTKEIKVGDTFAELLWTDRTAYIVTRVNNQHDFYAKRLKVEMKDWTDGTQYPVKDENGAYITEGANVVSASRASIGIVGVAKFICHGGRTADIVTPLSEGYQQGGQPPLRKHENFDIIPPSSQEKNKPTGGARIERRETGDKENEHTDHTERSDPPQ